MRPDCPSRSITGACAFAVLLLLTCAPAAFAQIHDPANENLRRSAVVRAVDEAGPAVVNINTEQVVKVKQSPFGSYSSPFSNDPFFRRFFEPTPRQYTRTSLGSGVIIDPRGYILTNEHVVNAATRITVALKDGRELEAEPIGAVPAMDLAILKIDSDKPLPAVKAATSEDLMIGETVIAIGNPFGLSNTVTVGVISALHRSIRADRDRVYSDFIQIDASINPGNSGGPLLNISGELIGINTAIFNEGEGIGFAIPISKAMRVVDDLITYGEVKQGYCGVRVQELNQELASALQYTGRYGVVVTGIDPGSPADGSGVVRGDVIHAIGAEPVVSVLEFDRLLKEYSVGNELVLHFYRGNQPGSVRLKLAEFPERIVRDLPWNRLGIQTKPVSGSLIRKFNLAAREGLVVVRIRPGSSADRLGVRPGDVILRVNNVPTVKPDDLLAVLRKTFYHPTVVVIIQRERMRYHVMVETD